MALLSDFERIPSKFTNINQWIGQMELIADFRVARTSHTSELRKSIPDLPQKQTSKNLETAAPISRQAKLLMSPGPALLNSPAQSIGMMSPAMSPAESPQILLKIS